MLSLNELNELELKFAKLNANKPTKNNTYKYAIVAVLSLILILSSVLFFTNKKEINVKKEQPVEQNLTLQNEIDEVIKNSKNDEKLGEKEQGYLKLSHIQTSEIFSTQSEANTKTKPKIKIKMDDAKDSKHSQKEQFSQTKDIQTAISIAQEYLDKKDYTNALEWSLHANEIDKQNKQSWIIFATAKYHLGQKQDALRALRTYNSNKNHKDINLLIRQIQNGSL
ncbi:CDC27 family protein [Campylobacter mucosalis]|uniref:CDC27 family protein n=1 Tax=Campylobacter mucosalis TaxID=202 RepID=UPI0014701C54|nr:CDC27 family protein [Campylobacter mucosalis]